jgi:hypothetical protein
LRNVHVIAAIDRLGGYSKEGAVPFDCGVVSKYMFDTMGINPCIVSKPGFDTLSALFSVGSPGTKMHVLTRELLVENGVLDIGSLNLGLLQEGEEKFFFLGGGYSWDTGLQLADTVNLMVINKDFECDKFFRTSYLEQWFYKVETVKSETDPDVVFLTYKKER